MFQKLASLEERYEELSRQLSDPNLVSDLKRFQNTARAHSELEEIVEEYRRYKSLDTSIRETRQLLHDEEDVEMAKLAREELAELEEKVELCTEKLRVLLLPRDPNDERDVILEIRAGTGGDEATLFAHEMFRMYSRYAESKGWKTEVLSVNLFRRRWNQGSHCFHQWRPCLQPSPV